MTKTTLMILSLAGVFLFGTACFGLFGSSKPAAPSAVAECAGLSGQARVDCEQKQKP